MQMRACIRGLELAMIIGMSLIAWPGLAQDPYRLRGSIVEVDLPKVEVESKDGTLLDLTLNESTHLFVVTPGSQDDLEEGQFIGVTSIQTPPGQHVALEVHIFAEALRGLGEGHYPWDLVDEPNMMTNATIAEIEESDGQLKLAVSYTDSGDAQQTAARLSIDIPSEIPIVHLARGNSMMLAPGRDAFLYLNDSDAGRAIPLAIIVGDGIQPPM
ncbi:MAG: hypothetical protein ACR2QF_12495 [Geminicoccaceae bacterium]